ncbi:hypothetical protein ES689_02770 [Frigoribacterium sp. ACAM 257]|uniref:hypothetical protein n=1 Tax=Frigoribacterium sp. ACAM 257 TaxID=2508998 RepID=UPI0011B9D356|nr:hypothetical protein [Frigoribacterium sp. ACAM 257]TWX40400.1 hypothetical protein ES689_02770 [Frigoribacterium sp. ACAM 257]
MSGRVARRRALGRGAVLVALVVALVGTGTGTGWALWTATVDAASQTTFAKVDLELESSSPRAVDYTAVGQSVTTAVTIYSGGTVPADYRLSVVVGTTGAVSADLPARVDVQAWPATTASCTSAVPPDAIGGTWASAPVATGTVAASSRVTWCYRSTVSSSAPDKATVNPRFEVVGGSHGWTDRASIQDFYQNTRFASPAPTARALSCGTTDTGDGTSFATVSWDAPLDSDQWGLFVAGQRVGNTVSGQAPTKEHVVTRDHVPASLVPDGRVTVDVRSVAGAEPGPVAWTGAVVVGPNAQGQRQVSCP